MQNRKMMEERNSHIFWVPEDINNFWVHSPDLVGQKLGRHMSFDQSRSRLVTSLLKRGESHIHIDNGIKSTLINYFHPRMLIHEHKTHSINGNRSVNFFFEAFS